MSTRIKDANAIEERLLELAHTTDAKITAPALAYFAPCSIEDADRVLDNLAARGTLGIEVDDEGTIVYEMANRQKIERRGRYVAAPTQALVPVAPQHRDASPLLAAALTLFIPGAGHLYAGRILAAVLWFLVVSAGYTLILPGLVFHLFAIASAASSARRLNPAPSYRMLNA